MDQLKVRIVSPKKVLFEDKVLSVSSKNAVGKFDILPGHANFVSIIENFPITVRRPNRPALTFQFPFAIVRQMANTVSIYTDVPS